MTAQQNKIMLITYADSLGKNLKELNHILLKYFEKTIGGVHILPFYPSSADRGFAPITYEEVDPQFGDWKDIKNIGKNFSLMYDFMVNHISKQSVYFKDYLLNGKKSHYQKMFIQYSSFWEKGHPKPEDIDKIYKRKDRAPHIEIELPDNTNEKIWCTFDTEQIDLNLKSKMTQDFIKKNLEFLAGMQPSWIRLDAFAYAAKKPGSDCFFLEPEVWNTLEQIQSILKPYSINILPEVHERHSYHLKLAEKGYWTYDFCLPMLLLHTLYTCDNQALAHWFSICPRNQFTTLDTHDGIGVVDVQGLLSNEQIEQTKKYLFTKGANVKKVYSSATYGNLDIYQINCTYYSALGNQDKAYLLARALQFFAPGIPQVYYVGLLCGENDIKLLKQTKNGRDINRHAYSIEEIEQNLKRHVVQKLLKMMEFRNTYPAFNGKFQTEYPSPHEIIITRIDQHYQAVLHANLATQQFEISFFDPKTKKVNCLDLSEQV